MSMKSLTTYMISKFWKANYLRQLLVALVSMFLGASIGNAASITVSGAVSGRTETVYAKGFVDGSTYQFPTDSKEGIIFPSPTEDTQKPLYVSYLGPLTDSLSFSITTQYHRQAGIAVMYEPRFSGGIIATTFVNLNNGWVWPNLEFFYGDQGIPVYPFNFFVSGRQNDNTFHCPVFSCPVGAVVDTPSFDQPDGTTRTFTLPVQQQSTDPFALAFGPVRYRVSARGGGTGAALPDIGFYYTYDAQWSFSYEPFSTSQYVADALRKFRNSTNDSQLEYRPPAVAEAISFIVALRETSDATSGQNVNLRDAEYCLRGLRGGYIHRGLGLSEISAQLLGDLGSIGSSINNIYDIFGPVGGTKVRNIIKTLRPTGPNVSPPGGEAANYYCYHFGLDGLSMAQVISRVEALEGTGVPLGSEAPVGSINPTNPTFPDSDLEYKGNGYRGGSESFMFDVPDGPATVFLDPVGANVFAIAVLANKFVEFDYSDLLRLGYANLVLAMGEQSLSLDQTGVINLSGLTLQGVGEFVVHGNAPQIVDRQPVLGFRFLNSGPTIVDMASTILESTPPVDVYTFTGFLQPVENIPKANVMKAGAAVPVKFSLNGDRGLGIFAVGSPSSRPVSCDTASVSDAVEATITAGNSSLSYDTATDVYKYIWKTEKAWAGTCRELNVQLVDNTEHKALFKFTK